MRPTYLKPEFPPLFPAGFHRMTMTEVRAQFVAAPRFSKSISRRGILDGLTEVVARLSSTGIVGEVWLDGSFVTEKIDPDDVDILVRVASDIYDRDAAKRIIVDWASDESRYDSHSCDAYKWIEYSVGHPNHIDSEEDRKYWTGWYGKSLRGVPKGIIVVALPAT